MKHINYLLMTAAMLLCCVTANAADFSAGGIFYNIISDTEQTVEVTYHGNYSNNYSGSVTIPSTVTFRGKVYRVKSIGMYAFYSCPNLTSVVIPEGVTSIGDYAFEHNRNLTSITIPASVTEIGNMAFYNTAWLDKQPDGVVYAGKVLYDYKGTMPRNTSIEVKEGTASIAQSAFSRCTTLVSITIPESVTSIGGSAFYGCSSLYEIAIPDGVKSIGNGAFEGSGWYINQPDGVVYAGKVLYDYKGTMPENTSIEVKKGTTSIAERAFSGCSNLTSIILPDGVTSIGEYAFGGCGSLTSITLPDDVTSIGGSAFDGCSSLSSIILPEHLTSIGGSVFYGCSSLSEITIPDGVTEIGWSAFYGCSSLVSINIPSSVTEIGNDAFGDTSWYDNLGDGLIYINNVLHKYKGAMEYNTSIEVREGTVSISPCAFYGSLSDCNSLKSVSIPASVIKIGSQAFDNCRSLRTVNFAEHSKLTTIEPAAFLDCWSLTSINIPESVVSIDNSVFARCSDLANVTLPEDMTVIASAMFADCSNLKAIDIPKNVVCIGDDAFEGCSKLATITIPSGVTKIRDGAFKDCSELTSILCRAWTAPLCGSDVFSGVDPSIPVHVPSTYSYQSADGWSMFTNMHRFLGLGTCGDDLTWHLTDDGELAILGNGAMTDFTSNNDIPWYNNRTSITKLVIDEGVTTIGARAFHDCGNLTSIICKAKTPPTCYTNTFIGVSKSIPLHVPEASIAVYQAAETWKNFTVIKPLIVASGTCGENLTWYLTDGGELVVSGSGAMTDYTSYSNKAPWNEFCETIVKVTINEGVTSIGGYAFCDCYNMVSIVVPQSIIKIGESPFSSSYNNAFTSVYISSLEAWCHIEFMSPGNNPMGPAEKLYLNGEEITELVIPEEMTSIGRFVFAGADRITSVTIPESVTEIGLAAFYGCISLTNINIPESVTNIEGFAFFGCTKLASINIPNSVTNISRGCFNYCSSLKSITIPNSVTNIGYEAFSECIALTEITIPGSVIEIGEYVFNRCDMLSKIICEGATPPTAYDNSFISIETTAILNVPEGSKNNYANAPGWQNFQNIVEYAVTPEQYIITYMLDGAEFYKDTLAVGDTIHQPEVPEKEGYTFNGWTDVPEIMPAKDVVVNGSYTINKYLIIFKIDNEVIVSDSLAYGSAIVVPEALEKEGYTFDGWSNVPETMPAEDVTVTGSFSVNKYKLTYFVDAEEYYTDSVAYGSKLMAIEVPAKEGHTFSGWDSVPEMMPAKDVVVSGSYTVNKYLVTFKIGDEVIASDSLAYGSAIVAPEASEKEGHTFSGWGEVLQNVPAYDVTFVGSYTVNTYKVYYYVGDELVHTEEVAYGEAIPSYEYKPSNGDIFNGWDGEHYEAMPAHDVTYIANITSSISMLQVSDRNMVVYDLNGRRIYDLGALKSGLYIVNGKRVLVK